LAACNHWRHHYSCDRLPDKHHVKGDEEMNELVKNKFTFRLPAGSASALSRVWVLVALIILGYSISQTFLSAGNISNIITNASMLIILGIGQTIVIITNGPDLSSSSIMTMGAVVAGILMKNYDVYFVFAILAGLGVGFLLGALNGYMIAHVGIPSFIGTYGMNWAVFGFAYVLLQGYVLYDFDSTFRFIGNGSLFGFIQMPIVIMVILVVLGIFLLKKTNFGRSCYAVGSNPTSATMSGINTKSVIMKAFILSGVISAFAGILFVARMNAVQSDIGNAYLLPVIATVFMGGASADGGVGGLIGTVVGALVITIVTNCMNLFNVPSEWRDAILGVLIILTVLLDTYLRNRTSRKQTTV
jgi:ribose transport system permease protein